MSAPAVTIEVFERGNKDHARRFAELNREWLNEFFVVEAADEDMFSDPESRILDKDGEILFASVDGKLLGTGALYEHDEGVYEIAKMAVTGSTRGLGLGRRIAESLIDAARRKGARKLYIASNRKLAQALALYRSLGFAEVTGSGDNRYARADIFLEMPLAVPESGGPKGAEPTRYGDWEINGKCVDF
jgi:N-acetylglutamate synthase-like GNAT family acetyltransferase